jgi:hypothetical protein
LFARGRQRSASSQLVVGYPLGVHQDVLSARQVASVRPAVIPDMLIDLGYEIIFVGGEDRLLAPAADRADGHGRLPSWRGFLRCCRDLQELNTAATMSTMTHVRITRA